MASLRRNVHPGYGRAAAAGGIAAAETACNIAAAATGCIAAEAAGNYAAATANDPRATRFAGLHEMRTGPPGRGPGAVAPGACAAQTAAGRGNPDTGTGYLNVARGEESISRNAEAELNYQRAIDLLDSMSTADAPQMADALDGLVKALRDHGQAAIG